MGFRIFVHSLRLVFGQFGDALRISGVLFLIANVISFGALYLFPPAFIGGRVVPSWQWLLATVLVCTLYMWIAVGWHRFVLRDEASNSPVPVFRGDRILAYFGRGLQFGLLFVLAWMVGLGLIMLMMSTVGSNPVIIVPAMLVGLSILLMVSYRLAPLFPGAALGEPVGFAEAWMSTRGSGWQMLLLAVLSAIGNYVLDLPFEMLRGDVLIIAWSLVSGWIKLMVGISILTAIYGVYVEGRDIA